MKPETKGVLDQIDDALARYADARAQSTRDDCSDLPRSSTMEVITSLVATIRRLSPPVTMHAEQCEELQKLYNHDNPYMIPGLVGILKALRADYERGVLVAAPVPEVAQTLGLNDYARIWRTSLRGDMTPERQILPDSNSTEEQPSSASEHKQPSREVWVVHGRNTGLRDEIFKFLRALDLHPIEWTEATGMAKKSSAHIGEILDAAFARAGAVLVLLSPDDEAKLKPQFLQKDDPEYEKNLTGQARPNVIFEAGMAFAAHQDQTILLAVGTVRPFSNIAGRYVIKFDGSPEKRKELINSLRSAGCAVNDSGSDWLSAGDFSPGVLEPRRKMPVYKIPRPK